MTVPEAFWSDDHRCWFVPVSGEIFDTPAEMTAFPVRVELKDRQLWITKIDHREMTAWLIDTALKQGEGQPT